MKISDFCYAGSTPLPFPKPSVVNRRITKEKAAIDSENKTHHPSRKDPEGFGALKNKANLKVI